MRSSVIIFNYNYGRFLPEALESVLAQSAPAAEIICVDDASTDDSASILRDYARRDLRIKPQIHESNRGFLGAFNTGVAAATGDTCHFLDADDHFHPDRLQKVEALFSQTPAVDLVVTAYRQFGDASATVFIRPRSGPLGQSAIAVGHARYWACGQTSVLSVRRRLLERVFPYPSEWMRFGVQTGELGLVYGACIWGAGMYYLREPLTEYRRHGTNDSGKRHTPLVSYQISRLSHEIAEYYRQRANLPDSFANQALAEFLTWEAPTLADYRVYRSLILRSSLPWPRRLEHWLRARRHFRRHGG